MKVDAGTGRVKVGMSELEMLFRPAAKSWVSKRNNNEIAEIIFLKNLNLLSFQIVCLL